MIACLRAVARLWVLAITTLVRNDDRVGVAVISPVTRAVTLCSDELTRCTTLPTVPVLIEPEIVLLCDLPADPCGRGNENARDADHTDDEFVLRDA